MTPGLKIRGLSSRYGAEIVFENLSFDIAAGSFLALLGPSGVGKTTLLRILAGLEKSSAGAVEASDGQPLAGRVAYMAQQDLLLPWATVLDNVMLGAVLRRQRKEPDRAAEILQSMGLKGREKALPAAFSGGMRQRVALARTLYEARPVVLLDEPFSALDAITRAQIQDLAAEHLADRTVFFITHDPLEACRLGHQLLILSGHPPRLGTPIFPEGAPPRPLDNLDMLAVQGRILKQLAGEAG